MNLPVIVIGAGGHGRVILDTLEAMGESVIGVLDADERKSGAAVMGVRILGGDDLLREYATVDILLANGIGSTGDTGPRTRIFDRFKKMGYGFLTVVHPSAVVSRHAEVGEGAQILAGAVVQSGTRIGMNAIVNTGSRIDHDCQIGSGAHIAPGTILSGGVKVGQGAHVGAGAVVLQNRTIGSGAVVGAGAVVTRNVPEGVTVVGSPAAALERPAQANL